MNQKSFSDKDNLNLRKRPYHPVTNHLYAIRGFYDAFRLENSLKIQFGLGLTSVLVSLFLQSYSLAIINFIMAIIVMSGEMFNTAIERLCDLIQPEKDERVRIIKDVAAAAVLTLAVGWASLLILEIVAYSFGFRLV
jgi:diacylglycerol kinase